MKLEDIPPSPALELVLAEAQLRINVACLKTAASIFEGMPEVIAETCSHPGDTERAELSRALTDMMKRI